VRRPALVAAAACLLTAACASNSDNSSGTADAPPATALPATQPAVRVTGHEAYVVWPSASAWLLLRSSDSFRTVQNRTPVAVETDGGLVGEYTAARSAVAIGATDRLYRSPLLTAQGSGRWSPAELPGAVVPVQGAVAVQPGGAPSAIVAAAHGTLLLRATAGWRTLASGARLAGSGDLRLQTITWLTQRIAVVTGTSSDARSPVAFRTTDGGSSWQPVTGLPSNGVTALAPCRTTGELLLPVITRTGAEMTMRSGDSGASWQAGHRFTAASGVPAWGCSAKAVWTVADIPHGTHVLTSTDAGRTWHTAGTAPADLTSLAPVDAGDGYATSGGRTPTLYAVDDGARRFRPITLPAWVATVGEQMSTS
jgi:hypothetical protein